MKRILQKNVWTLLFGFQLIKKLLIKLAPVPNRCNEFPQNHSRLHDGDALFTAYLLW